VVDAAAAAADCVSTFSLALLLAPGFGTAVHRFPLMLVIKAPLGRAAMLSQLYLPKPCSWSASLLYKLGDSSRLTKRSGTESQTEAITTLGEKRRDRTGPLGPPRSLKDHESDVKEQEEVDVSFQQKETEQRLDG
jgi:hypothetical protein